MTVRLTISCLNLQNAPLGPALTGAVSNDLQPNPTDREQLAPTAISVHADFRRLVDILDRAIRVADQSDVELLDWLSQTKEAADRGLILSELLTKLTSRPAKRS